MFEATRKAAPQAESRFFSHRKARAELAQMFFDEIYKGSNVLVFGEDRAGETCVAAAFAVVDRSVLLDELPAVNPAVRNKEDRMARID